MKIPPDSTLYGILDLGYVPPEQAVKYAESMLRGGVDMLQLRAKSESPETIRDVALKVLPLCRRAGVPFLLNDHPSLTVEVDADGVHVGQDDTPIEKVREIVGESRIVGLSTHDLHQAALAAGTTADYIGFGPLYATPTKPDYKPVGLTLIERVHQLVSIPIFCIGGIKRENLDEVVRAGAQRVVIVSGILQAADPVAYIADCRQALSGAALAG